MVVQQSQIIKNQTEQLLGELASVTTEISKVGGIDGNALSKGSFTSSELKLAIALASCKELETQINRSLERETLLETEDPNTIEKLFRLSLDLDRAVTKEDFYACHKFGIPEKLRNMVNPITIIGATMELPLLASEINFKLVGANKLVLVAIAFCGVCTMVVEAFEAGRQNVKRSQERSEKCKNLNLDPDQESDWLKIEDSVAAANWEFLNFKSDFEKLIKEHSYKGDSSTLLAWVKKSILENRASLTYPNATAIIQAAKERFENTIHDIYWQSSPTQKEVSSTSGNVGKSS